jgi:N-acetylneuraminate synthase
VVEKHFTLRRRNGGPDADFSLERRSLRLAEDCKRAWRALAKVTYHLQRCERSSKAFRRSLDVVEDNAAGEELTAAQLR